MLGKFAEGVLRMDTGTDRDGQGQGEPPQQSKPVVYATHLARHLRKIGVSEVDLLYWIVNSMLFMAALLGAALLIFAGVFLNNRIDVVQLDQSRYSFQRSVIQGCICTGIFSILSSTFFLVRQRRKHRRRASLKHRSPLRTFLAGLLLVLQLLSAVYCMVMSYGLAGVLRYLDKQRRRDDIDEACTMLDELECDCQVLKATGVSDCDYMFTTLQRYETIIALLAMVILVLVSSCLVILLSMTLATLPHRMQKTLTTIWESLWSLPC